MSLVITLLTVFLVMVSLLLVLITLMQRPKQEGLGAAFGGGMMNDTFGAQTTDVLQKGTVWLTVAFFGTAILLTVLNTRHFANQRDVGNILEGVKEPEPFPALPGAPGTPGAIPSIPSTDSSAPVPATTTDTPASKPVNKDKADGKSPEDAKAASKTSEPAKSEPVTPAPKAGADKEKPAKADDKKASPPAKADTPKAPAKEKDKQ